MKKQSIFISIISIIFVVLTNCSFFTILKSEEWAKQKELTTTPANTQPTPTPTPTPTLTTTPLFINFVSQFPSGNGMIWGVDVSGFYAYVAYSESATVDSGLKIIDLTTISTPTESGFCSSFLAASKGVVIDKNSTNYVYVVDCNYYLRVIDVSNKSNPSIIASAPLDDFGEDVFVSGGYAFVSNGHNLRIINISTPTAPSKIGDYNTQDAARGAFISGNYAYIAENMSGLRIINITTPSSPTETGHLDILGYCYGVFVSGNYAYIANKSNGLRIIDISNPSNPTETGHYITTDARDVYVSGIYAYIADGTGGLRVLNITSAASPYEVGHYDTTGTSNDVIVVGDSLIFVADCDGGLLILQINP